jgi:hypothetical protein
MNYKKNNACKTRREKEERWTKNETDGWMDVVEKDLRNLVVVSWKTKAQELDGW